MTEIHDLDAAPDAWGIHASWIDAHDTVQRVDDDNIALFRDIIGEPPADIDDTAPIVTRRGRDLELGTAEVRCEDGTIRSVEGVIPDDFPFGYHTIVAPSGERRLIVSPGRCWLPDDWRAWGWTAQLYATRSEHGWGIGDLSSLRILAQWSANSGAGFVLINPLHAVAPTFPQEPSPYLPTSRRFRNPIYISIADTPGAAELDLSEFEARGRELNQAPRIDRDAVWALKREALLSVYRVPGVSTEGFAAWRRKQSRSLEEFGIWMAVALVHGDDWREWPAELRDPSGPKVTAFAKEHRDEVDFQVWLQWLLDVQLLAAGASLKVVQDLPIGVDGGGADAWSWQDVLATGVTVGAPPDLLSSQGQDWGSPPLVPWRLRAAGYQPFIESIRATMANAGGLRIDHVMGLFRLWWVPPTGVAADGAYVRYPSDDLLDIVALESHRQEAIVVGEDLGTVEAGVRESLAERAMLSYRLLWFEEEDPSEWPVSAMAAITTHDLPTVAGLWSGADLDDQREFSGEPVETLAAQRESLLAPLLEHGELDRSASVEDAVLEAHRVLGRAPSILISATLDDALCATLRPNMPGTPDRHNWCIPLEVAIENVAADHTANRLANVLNESLGS